MKENQKFSIKNRLKSFKYAFNGLKILLKEEHNARIHLLATVLVVFFGFILKIHFLEWIAVIFAIGMVFALEIINSAIENLADFVSPEKHEMIAKIKDLAAAAVLVGAISAFLVGTIIFIPKIISIF